MEQYLDIEIHMLGGILRKSLCSLLVTLCVRCRNARFSDKAAAAAA